jgi:hypothetical protein
MMTMVCLFGFYSASMQFRSYGAETGKMILAYRECYELKATPGSKPPYLLELSDASTPVIQIHLVTSYNQATIKKWLQF